MAKCAEARSGSLVSQSDLSYKVGAQWAAMSEEEKQEWMQIAAEKKREHQKLYPDYRYSPMRSKVPPGEGKQKKKRSKVGRARPVRSLSPASKHATSSSLAASTPASMGCTDDSPGAFSPLDSSPSYHPPMIVTTPASPPLSRQPLGLFDDVKRFQLETTTDSLAPIDKLSKPVSIYDHLHSFRPLREATTSQTDPSVLPHPEAEAEIPIYNDIKQLIEEIYWSNTVYDFPQL
jgi:hypothetical protein